MSDLMNDLETAQKAARAYLTRSETYSVQSVNRFSGKWQTESKTGDYSQARYDRAQLRKVKGRNKARIVWTVSGEEVAD